MDLRRHRDRVRAVNWLAGATGPDDERLSDGFTNDPKEGAALTTTKATTSTLRATITDCQI